MSVVSLSLLFLLLLLMLLLMLLSLLLLMLLLMLLYDVVNCQVLLVSYQLTHPSVLILQVPVDIVLLFLCCAVFFFVFVVFCFF